MCNGIERCSLSTDSKRFEMVTTSAVAAAQAPTPGPAIDQMLDALQLSESDVLADLGCGDGRILIAACQRFGCSAIGVEIDPAKADERGERLRRLACRVGSKSSPAMQDSLTLRSMK